MTLLPDKHVTMRRSLIGTGAHLLRRLSSPQTFNSLWEVGQGGWGGGELQGLSAVP